MQGFGGTVVYATSLALISHAFRGGEHKERGTAFGIYGAVLGIGAALGPVLGGFLTSGIGWRWIFFINIPVGVATIAVTLMRVARYRDPEDARLDWRGLVTFTGALGLLIYGLISSPDGWGLPKVYGSLRRRRGLFAAFLVSGTTKHRPMLDLALFRKPTFTGGLLAAFGLNASIYSVFTYLVLYLEQELGYSAAQTGVRFLALTAPMFVSSTVARRLTHAVPARLMIGTGFVLVGAGILADARRLGRQRLDAPASRHDRRWRGNRHGDGAAGVHRRRRGPRRASRDGLGHQHHVPAGGSCDRDRGRSARSSPRGSGSVEPGTRRLSTTSSSSAQAWRWCPPSSATR